MAREKKIGIYLITSPTLRRYVGESRDIHKRFIGYKNLSGCTRQTRLLRSLEKHGVDNHDYEILEQCEIEFLNERERYWQDYYDVCGKNGLNCRLTGVGEVPAMISEDTRRRMSQAGKIKMANISQSHLENIRKAHERRRGLPGKPRSETEKIRLRKLCLENKRFGKDNNMFNSQRFGDKNPFYNKKHTEETKEKVRRSRLGTKASEATLKIYTEQRSMGGNSSAKIVMNIESGVFFSCGKEAWIASGSKFTYSTFKSKLNGSNKYPLQYRYV